MILIIGGAFQGKTALAEKLAEESKGPLLLNVEERIREGLLAGRAAEELGDGGHRLLFNHKFLRAFEIGRLRNATSRIACLIRRRHNPIVANGQHQRHPRVEHSVIRYKRGVRAVTAVALRLLDAYRKTAWLQSETATRHNHRDVGLALHLRLLQPKPAGTSVEAFTRQPLLLASRKEEGTHCHKKV